VQRALRQTAQTPTREAAGNAAAAALGRCGNSNDCVSQVLQYFGITPVNIPELPFGVGNTSSALNFVFARLSNPFWVPGNPRSDAERLAERFGDATVCLRLNVEAIQNQCTN
jgi:hypothetical protein